VDYGDQERQVTGPRRAGGERARLWGWIVAAAAAPGLALGCATMAPAGHAGGPVGPPEPTRTQYLNPGTASGIPGFTTVVRDGMMVYVSGQVALDGEGRIVGEGDLRAQAAQAFANLEHALRIAGAIPREVLRLTIYVVDLEPGDLDVIREAGGAFIPAQNPPAGTVVGVARLPRPGLRIAVDATARVRATFRPVR
jgi:enamine deaminase RidA (YjgF/YER057c/UK114 family)